jgi:copper chaperone
MPVEQQSSVMERELFAVSGMTCTGCERSVENALRGLDGVTRVAADHTDGTVEMVVDEGVPSDALRDAIESAGYDVE